jgi:hypothetical protein
MTGEEFQRIFHETILGSVLLKDEDIFIVSRPRCVDVHHILVVLQDPLQSEITDTLNHLPLRTLVRVVLHSKKVAHHSGCHVFVHDNGLARPVFCKHLHYYFLLAGQFHLLQSNSHLLLLQFELSFLV